ncbi:hypothetical protein PCE1_004732 [Barthelona sp. PCE]
MSVIDQIYQQLEAKQPWEKEFLQAVKEVFESLKLIFENENEEINAKYAHLLPQVMRVVEPERIICFRVSWIDDSGALNVNKGFRVQFNSAIGPYKGGLRFHPTVNLGILKFLGFEQIFKNSLTGLLMGGGKGGCDFDPKGKSDREVQAVCQNFMMELFRHIGNRTDVPAGDIGVGAREIGFLQGMYRKLANTAGTVLTGKSHNWGGSLIRPEATGYGAFMALRHAMKVVLNKEIAGTKHIVSGSGNVAQYYMERCIIEGAIPVSCSDSKGALVKVDGFTQEDIEAVMHHKNVVRGRLSTLEIEGAVYHEGSVWDIDIEADCAAPNATQNEVNAEQVARLLKNGVYGVAEGANMPVNIGGQSLLTQDVENRVYLPGKLANLGGVGVSGLEMAQNYRFENWTREEVCAKLDKMMTTAVDNSLKAAEEVGCPKHLMNGANVHGALKVLISMSEQGIY